MKHILKSLFVCAAFLSPAALFAQTSTYLAGVVQNPTVEAPPLRVVAHFQLPALPSGISDFSAIASRDGRNVMLVSDHGFVVTARLERARSQQITGIQIRQVVPLLNTHGAAVAGSFRDAEGLAIDRRGRMFVSFEGHNRVWSYARLGAPAQELGAHRDFSRLRAGRGLEAVAIARNGDLFAIPERPARATYGFPSYRLRDGEWTGSFRLPQEGQYVPVSADFGPDGLLYVLERHHGARGYSSQVRRFAVRGRAITQPQVVMRTGHGQFGNLEGLTVFRDYAGYIRLLMVSDNEMSQQRHGEILDVAVNR